MAKDGRECEPRVPRGARGFRAHACMSESVGFPTGMLSLLNCSLWLLAAARPIVAEDRRRRCVVPDLLERLQSAVADRYTIERELGRGGMATVGNRARGAAMHCTNTATRHVRSPRLGALVAIVVVMAGSACAPAPSDEWISLFNGRDLTGWTPKITGSDLGVDPWETFRVQDGLLTVSYERYDDFGGRFGHLFYEEPFSHYQLRVEYRLIGTQVPDAPDWAFKNSGVMFHAQSPESMLRDQDFPISLEAQLLGGNGVDERPTANLCTPGTHVEMHGALVEDHCISSTSPTYHTEEWVTLDLLVLGDSFIAHVMAGDTVMSYARPVIGGGVVNGFDESVKQDGMPLTGGYIALQSESHPIQFRQVLLRRIAASPR